MTTYNDELRKKLTDEVEYIRNIRLPELLGQINEMSPTTHLPDEVMLLFFEAHLQNSAPGRRYVDLYTLISVCVRWRRIITDVPTLWAEIRHDWWGRIPTLLERSGDVPLDVVWSEEDGQWAEKYGHLKLALSKTHRLRSMDMDISSFTIEDLLNSTLVGASLPVLRKIDVFSRGDFSTPFPLEILARAPRLRELSLKHLSLDMVALVKYESLPPLESLSLSDEADVEYLGNVHMAVKLLSRFTHLRSIHLTSLKATYEEEGSDAGRAVDSDLEEEDTAGPLPKRAVLPALRNLTITGGTFSSPLFRLPASLTATSPYAVRIELPFWRDHDDDEDIANEWNEKHAAFARVVLRVLSSPSADISITSLELSHRENQLELTLYIKAVAGCSWRTITLAQSHAPSHHRSAKDDAIYDRSAFSILLPAFCSAPYGRRLRTIELRDPAALDHFATALAADTKSPTPEMLRSGEWDQLKATGGLANMIEPLRKLAPALKQRKKANLELPELVLSVPDARYYSSRPDGQKFTAEVKKIEKLVDSVTVEGS